MNATSPKHPSKTLELNNLAVNHLLRPSFPVILISLPNVFSFQIKWKRGGTETDRCRLCSTIPPVTASPHIQSSTSCSLAANTVVQRQFQSRVSVIPTRQTAVLSCMPLRDIQGGGDSRTGLCPRKGFPSESPHSNCSKLHKVNFWYFSGGVGGGGNDGFHRAPSPSPELPPFDFPSSSKECAPPTLPRYPTPSPIVVAFTSLLIKDWNSLFTEVTWQAGIRC